MKTQKRTLYLPEGEYEIDIINYDKDEYLPKLVEIYNSWRLLCDQLNDVGSRGVNLPDGLSEIAFCVFMNSIRLADKLPGSVCSSFDAYCLSSKKRIQVKACSVLPDLTSFGPKSEWDEIYFIDFYKDGKWDYSFDIYLIPNDKIYNQKVNKDQTVLDVQKLGKRPRFSIYKSIILANNMEPLKTCNLKTGEIS